MAAVESVPATTTFGYRVEADRIVIERQDARGRRPVRPA
jgi:hypothetical protein